MRYSIRRPMNKSKTYLRIPIADIIRAKFGKYVWEKVKDHPDIKTLKYVSPFSGKKYHVSP